MSRLSGPMPVINGLKFADLVNRAKKRQKYEKSHRVDVWMFVRICVSVHVDQYKLGLSVAFTHVYSKQKMAKEYLADETPCTRVYRKR